MTYPAYEQYKDSGIPWLGQVPEGWEYKKLSYIADTYAGYAFSSEDFVDNGSPLIRISDVSPQGVVDLSDARFLPNDYLNAHHEFIIKKQDIVIAMTGATIGKAGIYNYEEPALLNQRVCKISSNQTAEQKFVWYLLNSTFYKEHIRLTSSGGAQPNISDKQIVSCVVPVPNIEEQKAIAAFLDRKTAEIDALIAKKEALLALLEEKRTAAITHAVTKGLNPAASLKLSGIPWLGDIPEHWDLKRFKYIASCNDETLSENTDPVHLINYVDISSVSLEEGIKRYEQLTFENAPSRARRLVKDGDTIVSTVRTYLKAITAIRNPIESLVVSTGFAVIRPRKSNSDYVGYLVQSEGFVGEVVSKSVGVSYPAINTSDLMNIEFLEPPILEQKEIAAYLDTKTAEIDAAKNKITAAIERLREYRTALITHAVTGKIKVV